LQKYFKLSKILKLPRIGKCRLRSVILDTSEVEIRRTVAQAKKFLRPQLNRKKKKLGMVVHTCHSSYSKKFKIRGLWSAQDLRGYAA
jgi:hypothetical protein